MRYLATREKKLGRTQQAYSPSLLEVQIADNRYRPFDNRHRCISR